MDAIFMNSKILDITDNRGLMKKDEYVALLNLKTNNKAKITAPTRYEKFALLGRSYFASDNKDYFDNIIKNMNL